MQPRRVVITGLGWVTSLGLEVEKVFNDLIAGRSGISLIKRFDTSAYATKIGGEIAGWDGGPHIDKREAKRLDRFAQFALNAAIDAVRDAGLDLSKENPWRCGSILGSGIGGIEEFEAGHTKLMEKGPDRLSPFMIPKLMCNAGSGNISIYYHLHGPNVAVASACASAAHAIGDAFDSIRYNTADIMITGGSEAALTPLGLGCFIALRALSERNHAPEKASRPFDRDRDGFILSEGAGLLVIE
jgi:3-oxoacyl-[acyl-carrier-protein] synthase II